MKQNYELQNCQCARSTQKILWILTLVIICFSKAETYFTLYRAREMEHVVKSLRALKNEKGLENRSQTTDDLWLTLTVSHFIQNVAQKLRLWY